MNMKIKGDEEDLRAIFSQLNGEEILEKTLLKENRERKSAKRNRPGTVSNPTTGLMNVRKNLIPALDEAVNDKPDNGTDNNCANEQYCVWRNRKHLIHRSVLW